MTQPSAHAMAGGSRYRGLRLYGPLAEFHAAVDALERDTVPEAYYRRQQQSRPRRERPAPPLRLLVCGSRGWTDTDLLAATVDQVITEHSTGRAGVVLIEGDTPGADKLAGQLAHARGWQLEVYPADWRQHGRAAGPRRNARMLRDGRPDRVVAFTDDLATSPGTADLVRRAHAARLPVQVVGHAPEQREGVKPLAPSPAAQQLPLL